MSKKVGQKQKHIPLRTCIATGEKRPKKELIRLVRTPDGSVVVDLKGKQKGRGANLLPTVEAFDLAVKKKAIKRALKLDKPLTKEELSDLRKVFVASVEEKEFRPNNKPVTIRIKKEDLPV